MRADAPPAVRWTRPADAVDQVRRCWDRGRILAARLSGEGLFPMRLRLRAPDARAMSDSFGDVRAWIRALDDGSRARKGFGYEVEWTELDHRVLGRQRFPSGIVVPGEADALRLLGRVRDAERFQALADATLAAFPALRDWMARKPMLVLEHAAEWHRVLAVLRCFRDQPRPGTYLRQLEIPGVDSKFIEARRGLLSELLDQVLPPDAVDAGATPGRGFEQRYGLRSKPALVRFRLLDERPFLHGLSDLAIPAADFARLCVPVKRVFVTENEVNGLAFPPVPDALVVFGLGYGVDQLAPAGWLGGVELSYWGDIDTHGFAILDRLRAHWPHARSVLMDRETLLLHRDLWVEEVDPHPGSPTRLTGPEKVLFDELRAGALGSRVRLEQERIAFGHVRKVLGTLP